MNKQISSISKIYASALAEADFPSSEQVRQQLTGILQTIKQSKDLEIVMGNGSISTSKKIEIINSVFKDKIDEKLLNFLKILIKKNRFREIYSIFNAYNQILDKKSNKKNVEIISSINLDENMKNIILERLQQKLSCSVIPDWHVDESIIAGLEFKFDDYVIDSSVRSKLKLLSKSILR